jgi:hypothetical protein
MAEAVRAVEMAVVAMVGAVRARAAAVRTAVAARAVVPSKMRLCLRRR